MNKTMTKIEELALKVAKETDCVDIAEPNIIAFATRFLAASQAREQQLRDSLESEHAAHVLLASSELGIDPWECEALALPADDTALQARLKEEREKCADLAKEATAYTQFQTIEHYKLAAFIETSIRSMK